MTFGGLLYYIAFQLLVPLLFTLSFVSFLWGAFLYIIAGSIDEELQEKGKAVMFYGLVSFGFMVGVWTIFTLIAGALYKV
jgi:Type IV secretion system pilin